MKRGRSRHRRQTSSSSGSSSSSSSSSDSDRDQTKVSSVKVAEFPTIAQLPSWKAFFKTSHVEASKREDGRPVLDWLNDVERDGASLEEFSSSGEGVERLDKKFAIALKRICKGELGRRIVQEEELADKLCRILSGRQILYIIYQTFKTNPNMGSFVV